MITRMKMIRFFESGFIFFSILNNGTLACRGLFGKASLQSKRQACARLLQLIQYLLLPLPVLRLNQLLPQPQLGQYLQDLQQLL